MKLKLLASIFCLFILFAPAVPALADTSIQQEINSGLCAGSNLQIPSADGTSTQGCSVSDSSNDLSRKIKHLIDIMSAVVGVVAVAMIIIGGFRYVTSGGNDTSVTSAKNTILYAIIGLVIVAMSQILVHFTIKSITG